MARISGEIHIQAAKEEVWATIADLGAVQGFHPGVCTSYYTSERRQGVGASRHCDLKPFGSVEERATEWNEGESVTLEIYDGKSMPPFRAAHGKMSVESNGAGTIARLTLEYEMRYGLLGRVMDRLMVRSRFERMVPAVLAGLKRKMENGTVVNSAK
jgi:carbon monoxide dehydrogenase subunit G